MDEKFQRDMRDFRMEIDQTIDDFIQDTSIKTAEMIEYFEQLDASINAEMDDFRDEINNTIDDFAQDVSAQLDSLYEYVADTKQEIEDRFESFDASINQQMDDFRDEIDETIDQFVADASARDASLREYVDDSVDEIRDYVDVVDASLHEFVGETDASLREFVRETDASLREFVRETDASTREFVITTDASLREYVNECMEVLTTRQDEMDQTVAAAIEQMNVTLQQNLEILADVSVQEQVIAASYVSLDQRISRLENISGGYSAPNRSYGSRYGAAALTSYDMSSVFELELGDFTSVNFDTDENLVATVNNQTTDVFSTFSTAGNVVLYYDFLENGEFKRKFVEIQRTSATMGKVVSKG